jgi:hypothetical protein
MHVLFIIFDLFSKIEERVDEVREEYNKQLAEARARMSFLEV